MKPWLILQKIVALNTMYRKTLDKQVTYRTPKGESIKGQVDGRMRSDEATIFEER